MHRRGNYSRVGHTRVSAYLPLFKSSTFWTPLSSLGFELKDPLQLSFYSSNKLAKNSSKPLLIRYLLNAVVRIVWEFNAKLTVTLVEWLAFIEHLAVDQAKESRIIPVVHVLISVLVCFLKLIEVVDVFFLEFLGSNMAINVRRTAIG